MKHQFNVDTTPLWKLIPLIFSMVSLWIITLGYSPFTITFHNRKPITLGGWGKRFAEVK